MNKISRNFSIEIASLFKFKIKLEKKKKTYITKPLEKYREKPLKEVIEESINLKKKLRKEKTSFRRRRLSK